MFTCSNCGHKIDAPAARLPPFCPRCGTSTGTGSNPFADSLVDDEDDLAQLPPPPPMDSMPVSRSHGRSGPSKTLFGMQGLDPEQLELEDEGVSSFQPRVADSVSQPRVADSVSQPRVADSVSQPVATPAPTPAPKPTAPPLAKPLVAGKPMPAMPAMPGKPMPAMPGKPMPAMPAKPPPASASAKPSPPPLTGKPGAKPPPLPGKPSVPPPPLGGTKPSGTKPLAPPQRAPEAPQKPAMRAPSAPTGPGRPAPTLPDESGSFALAESGTFEKDDPFFTGDPDELPELGSITDGDMSRVDPGVDSGPEGMQEFEFEDRGSALELGDLDMLGASSAEVVDLPRAGSSASRLPEFDGIEMPEPAADELDLPLPVAAATDGLDLPMPSSSESSRREREFEFDGFAAPGGDLDLPMALDDDPLALDLPMPDAAPARPASSKPASKPTPSQPPSKPASKPTPSKPASKPTSPLPELSDDFDLDLPTPASDLPMAASDLPTPAIDLPTPASELPTSGSSQPRLIDDFAGFTEPGAGLDLELDDLPLPADSLPTPAASLPTPASDLPIPADLLPTPVESLGLDLGDDEPPTRHAPSTTPPKSPEPIKTGPPSKSPPPKPESRRSGRWIVYGVLGLVVAVAGVGVYGMGEGWFAGEEPPPPSANNQDPATKDPTPQTPGGEVGERSDAILAKFDEDSPAAYVQALDGLAQDPIAQAEAALLLHLRYGPDPVRLAQASKLIEAYVDNPAPHVRRVLGLALLSSPARASESLTWFGDDPRSQLYRAWALQMAKDPAQARVAAQAALAARPGDKAAALTLAELELETNPEAALTRLRTIVGQEPDQITAKSALLRATREQGLLAEAAQIGNSLTAVSVSAGYKAELLRTRASIALEQGNVAEAQRLIEQAIASDEQGVGPRLDKIALALSLRDSAGARSESELLLRQRPQDRDVLEAAVRVAIAAGREDDAQTHLLALGGPESTDAKVHALYGEMKALLLDIEGARQAWAKARELDPLLSSTVTNEVALLLKVQQPDQALALLDEQKAKLAAREDQSVAARAARATLERTRALLLRSQGKPGPALTAAEEAVTLDPRDNRSRLLRAELLGAVGNIPASEEALAELHQRTGGFPGLTEPLGRMLLRKGKLDELDALIGSQLEASEASVEILMTGATLRLAQNKPDQAKVLAQRVLDRDSGQTRAHLVLGRALLAEGEYRAALDEIEAAQTREGDPEAELWLGQALEYNARAVDARAHYKKALELEPGNLEAAALLGRLYAYEGAARQALELLEPVVQKTDAYPYAYLAIGIAHRDLNKRDQAVGEFQRARELDPTLFEAYYEEGRILNDRNKHSGAVAALQAGLDNAKDYAPQPRQVEDAWRRLGDSYYELGRRPEAKTAFEEYLKIAAPNAAGRAEVQRLMRNL